MGGDFGPPNLVAGAVMALRAYPHITKLFLVGDTTKIQNELNKHGYTDSRIAIEHSTQVVDMSDGAMEAIRRKKDSSISRAVDLVKRGQAEAVVSAGHTGAAVAASVVELRDVSTGVERPGIASLVPTESNVFVLCDAGANIEAKASQIVQYGIMGMGLFAARAGITQTPRSACSRSAAKTPKAPASRKKYFKMLKESSLKFRGNIEGRDLFENPCEVVVCDGFVGNVVLKTCESIAHAIFTWLKHEITKTPVRKIGAAMVKPAFKAIHKKTNWEDYGGSPLLGVNGIVLIAHGASTPLAIKNALRVAASRSRPTSTRTSSKKFAAIMKRQPRSSPRSARTQRTVSIVGTGSYLPDRVLTNEAYRTMSGPSSSPLGSRRLTGSLLT